MFNYRGQESKTQNLQVYLFDTPVTLKQNQGHEIYNGNVDPKQCHNNAKFERSCFNGVQEEANVKVFFFQMRK